MSPNAFAVVRTIAAHTGTDLGDLCSGLVNPLEAERDGLGWDAFCAVVERLVPVVGSLEGLAAEGALAMQVPELGPSIRILRMVTGPRGLYWANFRWGGPSLFRVVTTSFRVLPDGRYVGTIDIPPPHRDCVAYFHLCAGVFSALPRALGLPDSHVELTVTPRLGTYLIDPPPALTVWARAKYAFAAVFTTRELVDRLAAQNAQLALESHEAERARAEAVVARKRAEDALAVAEAARAAAEQARAEAFDALRVKSQFVGTMSHELRTPLNGMLGMTHLLSDTRLSAEQRDYVETIASSGGVLLQLINDVLDFSKIDAGRLTLDPVRADLRELAEVILQASSTRAAGRPVDVIGIVHADVPRGVVVDALRLRQVLSNLVDNAVKFTEQGEVVLEIRRVGAARLQCSVRDTGIGITVEQRSRIFQPFMQADGSTTRQYGGTGLGLTISAMIVGLMGGDLAVESVPGEGSLFHFEMDVQVVEEAPDPGPALGRVAVVAGPSQRRAVEGMLREAGWEVSEADAQVVIVDVDAGLPAPAAGRRTVGLARSPNGVSGHAVNLRKPVRMEDLRTALSRARAPSIAERLRVHVVEEDALHRRILGRLVTRLGHELGEGAPNVVLVRPDAIADARARWPAARVVAMAPVEEHEGCLALGAHGALARPVGVEELGRVLG